MFLQYFWIFLIALLGCMILSGWASSKVHSAFRAYGNMPTRSRMTGYDTATRLLRSNGVRGISVGRVKGNLSDHYHPTKKIVNLSESVYGNDSVAAVAVAAHEIGHVMQKKKGYAHFDRAPHHHFLERVGVFQFDSLVLGDRRRLGGELFVRFVLRG